MFSTFLKKSAIVLTTRTALYLRKSTDGQVFDLQVQQLTEYCARKGYTDVRCFEETASGAKQRRPVLDNLLELAKKGEIKRVLVYKLDRLGRSLSDLITSINLLNQCGCQFVSVSDNIDTGQDSPFARLQLGLLASIAEFERGLIRERVVSGLKAARAKGKIGGRPGLRQETKDRIRYLLAEGFHPRTIAREVGISPASVYKAKKQLVLTA